MGFHWLLRKEVSQCSVHFGLMMSIWKINDEDQVLKDLHMLRNVDLIFFKKGTWGLEEGPLDTVIVPLNISPSD